MCLVTLCNSGVTKSVKNAHFHNSNKSPDSSSHLLYLGRRSQDHAIWLIFPQAVNPAVNHFQVVTSSHDIWLLIHKLQRNLWHYE